MAEDQRRQTNWHPLAIGAASAIAATSALILCRPRKPSFDLISITLSSFRLNLPLLDIQLTLTIHVTNPNLVPIHYLPSKVSISYRGSHLGSADLLAGSQPALSCRLVRLPARLDGLQMAAHAPSLLLDATKREMELQASVDITGAATLIFWEKTFQAHVESHVVVDPIFLDVIEQDNTTETQFF